MAETDHIIRNQYHIFLYFDNDHSLVKRLPRSTELDYILSNFNYQILLNADFLDIIDIYHRDIYTLIIQINYDCIEIRIMSENGSEITFNMLSPYNIETIHDIINRFHNIPINNDISVNQSESQIHNNLIHEYNTDISVFMYNMFYVST